MPLYEITTNAPQEEQFYVDLAGLLSDVSGQANPGASTESKELNDLADRATTLLGQVMASAPAPKRLVEADSTSQAIRHCAQGMFNARTIGKPAEVAQLMASGIALEKAKAAKE